MDIPEKLTANLKQGWQAIKYENETFAYLYPASEIIRGEFEAFLWELQAAYIRLRQKEKISVEPTVPLGKAPKMGTQVKIKILGTEYTWLFAISRRNDSAELSVYTGNVSDPVRTISWPMTETNTKEIEIRAFVQAGCNVLLQGIEKDLFKNDSNENPPDKA